MTEHTKEPWRLGATGVEVVGDHPQQRFIVAQPFRQGSEGPVLSHYIQAANARRIVACVNACKGIGTDVLEKGRVSPDAFQFEESRADIAELHRDELLAALGRLHRWAESQVGSEVSGDHPVAQARAAIVKARGKA